MLHTVARSAIARTFVFVAALAACFLAAATATAQTQATAPVPAVALPAPATPDAAVDLAATVSAADLAADLWDFAGARRMFLRACNAHDPRSCLELASFEYHGTSGPVAKSAARARVRLHLAAVERACATGELNACVAVGIVVSSGIGGTNDPARAVAMYQQACDGGSMRGCGHLASRYDSGRGVAKDSLRAIALFRQSCLGGSMSSCMELGVAYRFEYGFPRDPVAVVALFSRACAGGAMRGCSSLGLEYERGAGVAKDPTRAAGLFHRACDGGDDIGCWQLSKRFASGTIAVKDPTVTAAVHRKACDDGMNDACDEIGAPWRTTVKKPTGLAAVAPYALRGLAALTPVPHDVMGASHSLVLAWPIRPVSFSLLRSKPLLHQPMVLVMPSIEPQYRMGDGWRLAELLRLTVSGSSRHHDTVGAGIEGGLLQTHGQTGSVFGALVNFGRRNHSSEFAYGFGVRRSVAAGIAQYDVFLDFHLGAVFGADE